MKSSFETAAKPLVFTSDVSGTLFGRYPNGFNSGLFDLLVQARQQAHIVIITTAAETIHTFKMIGDRIREILKERGLSENLFDLPEGSFNPDIQPLAPKSNLSSFIHKQGIERVDFVFDDEKYTWLNPEQIGQHINPKIFIQEDNAAKGIIQSLHSQLNSPSI